MEASWEEREGKDLRNNKYNLNFFEMSKWQQQNCDKEKKMSNEKFQEKQTALHERQCNHYLPLGSKVNHIYWTNLCKQLTDFKLL